MITRIRSVLWEDVFEDWKQREGNDPGWIYCATVLKGWQDWESWRRFTAEQLSLPKREWAMCEFSDPMKEIPQMLVGPFSGWQSRLPAPNRHTFIDLARIPEQAVLFRTHEKVASMIESFPSSTTFIGLQREDGRIVCIEGHHRATAVALAQQDHLPIDFGGPVQIALAPLKAEELDLLDRVLARGTSK